MVIRAQNHYLVFKFISGAADCPVTYLTQACIELEGQQYVIGCKAKNWYDARIYCYKLGGDLAIIDTQIKINTILEYVTHRGLFDKCGWLFVGLRKEEWVIRKAGVGKIDHISKCWVVMD